MTDTLSTQAPRAETSRAKPPAPTTWPAFVIAIVVAVAGAVAGSQWDILANLDSLPRIPVTPETFTIAGILTALVAAVVALIGAILGGMLGMRYHRRVDRVGLEGLSQR